MQKPISLKIQRLEPEAVYAHTSDGLEFKLPRTLCDVAVSLGDELRLISIPATQTPDSTIAQALLSELLGPSSSSL